MKASSLFACLFGIALASFAAAGQPAAAPGATPAASPAPPPYQIKVNAPGVIQMGDTIRIGLFDAFGTEVKSRFGPDPVTTGSGMALYLDGVLMAGLKGQLLGAEAFGQVAAGEPAPALVVQYTLDRQPSDDANRKAWDTLLDEQLHYGENSVEVGVGLNNGIPHLADVSELTFQVCPVWEVWAVGGIGLVLLAVGMMWAIISPTMLRDAGAQTRSLGKTQMAFWGLVVALSFAGVMIISHRMERIPPQVLVLLGISGSTGLSSIMITASQRSAAGGRNDASGKDPGAPAKLEAEKTALSADQSAGGDRWNAAKEERLAAVTQTLDALKAKNQAMEAGPPNWFQEIISDGDGPSFHRFQVVLWTIILGAVFVYTVVTAFSMPEFDNTLLILMGISNGTYLGFKIQEK
jgi:hypothetical protein